MANKPRYVLAINKPKLYLVDSDQLVNLEGYNIVRRERNKHGGGVRFYLRNTITYSRQYQLENNDLELIAFEIQKPNSPGTGQQTNVWIILKIRNFFEGGRCQVFRNLQSGRFEL